MEKDYKKLGGWLLVFMITSLILTIYPIYILIANVLFVIFYYGMVGITRIFLLVITFGFVDIGSPNSHFSISLLHFVWAILNAIFFIIILRTISLKKKKGAKTIIILLLVHLLTDLTYVIADILTGGFVIVWTVDFDNIAHIPIPILILTVIFPYVWLLYFRKSKRVAAYFYKDDEEKTDIQRT